MRKFVYAKRFLAMLLSVLFLATPLYSCSPESIEIPVNERVIFSTLDEDLAPMFSYSEYDIEVKLTETNYNAKVADLLTQTVLYAYNITINVYEKNSERKLVSQYVIEESFTSQKTVYEVLDYHEQIGVVKTHFDECELAFMLQDVFEELALTAVYFSCNQGGVDISEAEIAKLAEDLCKDTAESFKAFAYEYAGSITSAKEVLMKTVKIFDNFPVPDGLTNTVKTSLIALRDAGEYVENNKLPGELSHLTDFMAIRSVEGITDILNTAVSTIDSAPVEDSKKILAEKTDDFAKYIIDLSNK